jgi:hypothetical protein
MLPYIPQTSIVQGTDWEEIRVPSSPGKGQKSKSNCKPDPLLALRFFYARGLH